MSALARALPRCGALPRPRSGQRVVVDNADACRLRFARMSGAELLTLGVPLDLNTAPETALRALPGIGPVLAARIVADRRRRGVYPSVDALQRVRGIGEKTVARLRGLVSVTAGASER